MKIKTLLLILVFYACSKSENPQPKSLPKINAEPSKNRESSPDQQIADLNKQIIEVLKLKDYKKLSTYIHPEKGVRFSMYSYISDQDKMFSKAEFEKYLESETRFTFGTKDGSGASYIIPLFQYIKEWVFNRDFTKANVNYNNFEGKGNTLNNIQQKYPGAITVENYMAGTVAYSYMDWNSLILVFEELGGQFYLVGIANIQWTV